MENQCLASWSKVSESKGNVYSSLLKSKVRD